MKRATGGFTLIELLVVIAIIALLSAIVLASLNTARAKGRNAKRADDVHQYQLSFELYFDKYGSYPATGNGTGYVCLGQSGGSCWTGGLTQGSSGLYSALAEYFPGEPPGDTVENVSGYVYRCMNAGCSRYEMKWNLEGLNLTCTNGATGSLPAGKSATTQCDYQSQ